MLVYKADNEYYSLLLTNLSVRCHRLPLRLQPGNPLPFMSLTLTKLVGITPYRFDYIVQNPQAGLLGYNATPISFGDYLGVPFFNFDSAINLNPNGKFDYGYNNSSGSGGIFPSAPGMMPIIP